MNNNSSEFLGKDKIFPLLMKMAIPAAIGMIVNALYNVVDTIFVGQGVGPVAIAALSIAFPIQLLSGSIAQAIGIGSSSIMSRKLGEKSPEEAAKTAGTAITFILIFGIAMTMILLLFLDPILRFFGASDTILPLARDYVQIIAIGILFNSFAMAANGLVRSEGNAKVAMYGMLIGTVFNIILDPIFIFALDMGIQGAALATIIGQFFSFSYMISFYLRKKSILPLKRAYFRIKGDLLRESFILGLPNFIQMAGMSILVLIINQTLGTFGGDLAISTYGMINRLFSLVIMPLFGLVQGFQPIAGYNFGAQRYDRVKEVLKVSILSATVFASLGFLLCMIFPRTLMGLFTSDVELIISSAKALRIYVLFVPIVGLQLIGSSYYQAVGKKIPSLILSLSRQFLVLIPMVLILPHIFGLNGVWFAFPVSDLLSSLITSVAMIFEIKRLTNQHQTTLEPLTV